MVVRHLAACVLALGLVAGCNSQPANPTDTSDPAGETVEPSSPGTPSNTTAGTDDVPANTTVPDDTPVPANTTVPKD